MAQRAFEILSDYITLTKRASSCNLLMSSAWLSMLPKSIYNLTSKPICRHRLHRGDTIDISFQIYADCDNRWKRLFFRFQSFQVEVCATDTKQVCALGRSTEKKAEPRDKTKLSDSPRSLPVFISNHLQLINIENRWPVIGAGRAIKRQHFTVLDDWNHGRLFTSSACDVVQLVSIFNFNYNKVAWRRARCGRRSGDLSCGSTVPGSFTLTFAAYQAMSFKWSVLNTVQMKLCVSCQAIKKAKLSTFLID